jgi:hypothetical protein
LEREISRSARVDDCKRWTGAQADDRSEPEPVEYFIDPAAEATAFSSISKEQRSNAGSYLVKQKRCHLPAGKMTSFDDFLDRLNLRNRNEHQIE